MRRAAGTSAASASLCGVALARPQPQAQLPTTARRGVITTGAGPGQSFRERGGVIGVTTVDPKNFDAEISKAEVATLMYFHVGSSAAVRAHSVLLMNLVTDINRKHMAGASTKTADGNTLVGGEQVDPILKLAMVDCNAQRAIAQQFGVALSSLPEMAYVHKGMVLDRMLGAVPEAQLIDSINSFLRWVEAKNGEKATDKEDKPSVLDLDEENVVTLLQAAMRKAQDKDFAKATTLFDKLRKMAEAELAEAKVTLMFDKKRVTDEMLAALKEQPSYNVLPQAICGQAMVYLQSCDFEAAQDAVEELRRDHGWAVKELSSVSDTVCRIDLLRLSKYDVDDDSYMSLMKQKDLLDDPVTFYRTNLKLAAAHYFEKHARLAMEELLKLIRVEPKLLPQLKQAGITQGLSGPGITPLNATPARRMLFLIFDALGPRHEDVIAARKKMAAYFYA
jgi:thioredoxin-like negative regulator of GroEL